jgi:hypothetical protein
MYKIDPQGQIIRIDGKVILKDVTNVDYQLFMYVLANRVDPATHLPVGVVSKHASN